MLGQVLPAFEMLRFRWEDYCSTNPSTALIVQPGLLKLAEYQSFAQATHAYIIATSMFYFYINI